MKTIGLFFFITFFCFPPLTLGAEPGVVPFNMGIGAFQKKEFAEATKKFEEAVKSSPNSVSALYNWGLSLYNEGKTGLAVAAWRRARTLSPTFRESHKALEYAKKHVHSAAFDEEGSDWEAFRNFILVHTSFHWLAGFTLLLLFLGGFYVLRYMALRKFALIEEAPLPSVPVSAFLVFILGIIFFALSTSKIYDQLKPRATVITERVAVYTAPSTEDNQIFELLEGVEVFPLRSEGAWVQVRSLGGLSGWIQNKSIYYTSGRQLW